MADLEKNILVVIPVNEDHKKFLEEKAASGNKNCCVRYVNGSDVTVEDVKEANVIIGNVDPALVKEAKNLELFQLNSAGADQYIKPGILPEQAVLANATGAYGLAVSEHMLALTFDLIRRFNQYHANQAKHIWQSMGKYHLCGRFDDPGARTRRYRRGLREKVPCTRRSCDRCPPHEP